MAHSDEKIMTIRTHVLHLTSCLLLLFLTACGSSDEETAATPTEASTVAAPTNTPVPTVVEEPVVEEPVVEEAESDSEMDEAATESDDTEEEAASEDATETEEVAEEEIPYFGRAPEDMWASLACSACHMLDQEQTDSNRGPVGPHQGNLAERAAQIAPEISAEEYVYTSIVEPNAYVVDGYFENVMPQNYAEQMSEEEIRALAKWLLDQ